MQCQHRSKKGRQCKYISADNSGFCSMHKPSASAPGPVVSPNPNPTLTPGTPRKIRATPKVLITKKQCKDWVANPTVNPLTGRLLHPDSLKFDKMVQACLKHGVDIPKPVADSFVAMFGCNTDTDPIGAVDFDSLSPDEISDIIKLSSGNCYDINNIYGWYKAQVSGGKPVTDPMNPSYILTDHELHIIDEYMKLQDPAYTKPHATTPLTAIPGYELKVDEFWGPTPGIHAIYLVKTSDRSQRRIGSIHMGISEGGIDSNAVVGTMASVWLSRKLMQNDDPSGVTGIPILDLTADGYSDHLWYGGDGRFMHYDPKDNPEMKEIIMNNLARLQEALTDRLS